MKVLVVDYQSSTAAEQFIESIRNTGFGVLTNHPINHELIQKVYEEWKAFFSLPEAEKCEFLFKRDYETVQDGFFPTNVAETAKGYNVKDLKEFYHYSACAKRLPACISSATQQLRDELVSIAKTLLKWLEEALPSAIRQTLSMPLSHMIDEKYQTLLRILHYPPLPDTIESGAVRAAAHEDINFMTLLVAASAPGLQVKDAKGQWHEVPCEKNNMVVNVGDMLQETVQGFYRSTSHQVVNPIGEAAKESRYSMPLFLHPRDEVKLSDRYTAKSYLNERLTELGLLEKI